MKKIIGKSLLIALSLTLVSCSPVQTVFATPSVPILVDTPESTKTLVPAGATPLSSAEIQETAPVATVSPQPLTVTDFPDPAEFSWNLVAEDFSNSLGMASLYDNSNILYILEQEGVIKVVQDGAVLPTDFLDIQDRVGSNSSEQGLLGIALDPDYKNNREFYLNYTNNQGNTVISRFVAEEGYLTALPSSEQILLSQNQPYANHNGGNLVFGPDGFLYIGLGDGGSGGDPQGNAQNTNTLLGKMLRIAVSGQDAYAIPADNPYANGGGRAEIWATGLRNPWRYSFDRLTGDLFIADVGQGNWEEINFLTSPAAPGENFGWDYREGSHPYEGTPPGGLEFVDPIAEYDHSQGCSVTGGYVYRGQNLPEWNGVYFFGDYCSGVIWGLLPAAGGGWNMEVLFETGQNISSFGEDAFGEIYLISLDGSLFKLERNADTVGYLPIIVN
jgi:glucose/arabinose dehydrogenase